MRLRAFVVSLLLVGALLAPSALVLVPSALAASVTLTLNYNGNPETTKIVNASGGTIMIKTVGSLYQARSNEPSTVNQRLAKGASIGSGERRHRNRTPYTRPQLCWPMRDDKIGVFGPRKLIAPPEPSACRCIDQNYCGSTPRMSWRGVLGELFDRVRLAPSRESQRASSC